MHMETVKATPTQTLLFYPAQIISTTASPLENIKQKVGSTHQGMIMLSL
jgi:hypothetical protein